MTILTKVVYKIEWHPNQKANTILHGNIKSNLKIYLETKKSSDIQINSVLPTPNKEWKEGMKGGSKEGKEGGKENSQASRDITTPHFKVLQS